MQINKRNLSAIFLFAGMLSLFIGFLTDNAAFSVAAVVLVLLSLLLGGRWLRRRKK